MNEQTNRQADRVHINLFQLLFYLSIFDKFHMIWDMFTFDDTLLLTLCQILQLHAQYNSATSSLIPLHITNDLDMTK